jgi:hypothetical protein
MQVHKRNKHSKRMGNMPVNRRWKRAMVPGQPNRAARREPLRAAYAANIAALEVAAEVAPPTQE